MEKTGLSLHIDLCSAGPVPAEQFSLQKNADTFPPLCGGKVLAALAERLAKQGIQGIRSHSRRAAVPSSSPALSQVDLILHRVFDKLKAPGHRSRRFSYIT